MPDVTMMVVSPDGGLPLMIQGIVSQVRGVRLETVPDYDAACVSLVAKKVAVVLCHLTTDCHVAGLTRLLGMLQATGQRVPVLVLSDEYQASQALTLLRLGVAEYLSRPLDLGRLAYLVDILTLASRRGAVQSEAAREQLPTPPSAIPGDESFFFVSGSRMTILIDQIRRIAPQNTTVLLGGETGTGKSRLAGAIHRLSNCRDRPFLTINCGALSSNLIESEMFGHVKGAFTGADANRDGKFTEVGRGTLFLDEIDSLPAALQAKLLRAVEERAFEPVGSNKTQKLQARLIVASNRPLDQEVASGRFRSDLFYRLNVIAFNLPPLRERKEDIPGLTEYFLREYCQRGERPQVRMAPEALSALQAHSWPGNIRELRNVIERAVALSDGTIIRLEHLPEMFHDADPVVPLQFDQVVSASTLAQSKDEAERARIAQALEKNGNNRLRAAAELGISRMTLYNKLHKLGLIASQSRETTSPKNVSPGHSESACQARRLLSVGSVKNPRPILGA
jgi:two-component system response regulator HydG